MGSTTKIMPSRAATTRAIVRPVKVARIGDVGGMRERTRSAIARNRARAMTELPPLSVARRMKERADRPIL